MDDKELPGFKINDYSGDGNGGTEEAGHTESLVATGDAQSGEGSAVGVASMAGGAMENGPVTHGEGEIKPVMVENEQVGGAGEKAPKMASEGLGEHFEDLGGVSNGLKSDAKIEGPTQVTEAEARAMLIEDNARAKEALKKASNRGKKTLVVVIILAVALIAVGVVASVIIGGMNKENGNGGSGNNDKQEGNGGGNSTVVEKPEEPKTVELALDDEVVQRLYGPFAVIKDSYQAPFYSLEIDDYDLGDEAVQQRRRKGRLSIAYLNSPMETCKATIENGGLVARYGDFILANWSEEQKREIEQCVSGEHVRQNFKDIFGYEIELKGFDNYQNPDEVADADGVFTASYSPSYDEFYYNLGGAGTPNMYKRRLVRATKEADRICLYEQVLGYFYASWAFPDDDDAELRVSDLTKQGVSDDDNSLTLTDTKTNIEKMLEGNELFNRVDDLGDLGLFKWTFEKNAEGNYVFKGLERVE